MIAFDRPSCVAFENPTLQVRIVNPNYFPVTLRGFVLGYIEPQIDVLGADDDWHRLYYGPTDSAWTNTPVTIPPGGSLQYRRFLYGSFAPDRWPADPGVFRLRAKTHLSSARAGEEDGRLPIEWDCPNVQVSVVAQSAKDQVAMEFMRQRLAQRAEDVCKGGGLGGNIHQIRLEAEFLQRFPESAYAPEIRWEIAKLLQDELGNDRIPEQDVPQMVDVWDQCITFCLERGGAYAEDFLKLGPYNLAHGAMELALKHKKHDLLKRIASEVDQRYPDDEPAKLYRRFFVVEATESLEKARPVAEELIKRFPDSEYVKRLPSTLNSAQLPKKRD